MKKIDVIVTGPIDKKSIQNSKFSLQRDIQSFLPILQIKMTH